MRIIMKSNKSAAKLVVIIVSIPMFLTGAVFLTIGIVMNRADKALDKRCTETVTAEVTELDSETGSYQTGRRGHRRTKTYTTYAPRFSYTIDGREYNTLFSRYSSPPEFEVGEQTEIRYDPDEPTVIYVESSKSMRTMSIIFIIIGSAALAVGVILVIAGIAVSRKKPADEMQQYYSNF